MVEKEYLQLEQEICVKMDCWDKCEYGDNIYDCPCIQEAIKKNSPVV